MSGKAGMWACTLWYTKFTTTVGPYYDKLPTSYMALKQQHKTVEEAANSTKMGWNWDSDNEKHKIIHKRMYDSKILGGGEWLPPQNIKKGDIHTPHSPCPYGGLMDGHGRSLKRWGTMILSPLFYYKCFFFIIYKNFSRVQVKNIINFICSCH